MTLFDKCRHYTAAREAQAAGVYPYFVPIEQSTSTEVLVDGHWKVMVGSNNYLGLTHHPKVLDAARKALTKYGSGSTGSRLLNGTLDLHYELEERLARFLKKPAALVFSTGYQSNLGAIAALVGRDDHVFLDKLDHASIIDGAKMAFGEVHRYAHGDFEMLDRKLCTTPAGSGKLVVTDGVFSMEGSVVDLPGLVPVVKKNKAHLMVDDAHALGVLGADGSGTAHHFGLEDQVDLIMVTFSKSLASIGGAVAGPEDVIHYMRHHSRALIFSASMPPSSVAGVLAALDILQHEPERRERLWANTRRMAEGLKALGFDTGKSVTPIIPVVVGDMQTALVMWRGLFDEGVFAHPIVPPAVPPDSCRIRISMTAEHSDEQVDRVIDAFERVARKGMRPRELAGRAVARRG